MNYWKITGKIGPATETDLFLMAEKEPEDLENWKEIIDDLAVDICCRYSNIYGDCLESLEDFSYTTKQISKEEYENRMEKGRYR